MITAYYNRYRVKLIAIAYNYGYSKEEAEDMVQQFFLEIMQKELPGDIRNPEAFLVTAFKRRMIDYFRAAKTREAHHAPEEMNLDSTQEILERLETDHLVIEQLTYAYKQLPGRCRRVIYLKYYAGLTTQEIVEQTGLTQQNVYNNLSKGISLLRKSLKSKVDHARMGSLLMCVF
ncbi:RNA polymerase sigma factor [Niabella insulamsoli]|uniref:RNA polymerase sigma factor n=1 Tax=Niabella insulamsoli TaxID=3144874 RepID=UPI0031FC5AC4